MEFKFQNFSENFDLLFCSFLKGMEILSILLGNKLFRNERIYVNVYDGSENGCFQSGRFFFRIVCQ